jgi:hypothetical protein
MRLKFIDPRNKLKTHTKQQTQDWHYVQTSANKIKIVMFIWEIHVVIKKLYSAGEGQICSHDRTYLP